MEALTKDALEVRLAEHKSELDKFKTQLFLAQQGMQKESAIIGFITQCLEDLKRPSSSETSTRGNIAHSSVALQQDNFPPKGFSSEAFNLIFNPSERFAKQSLPQAVKLVFEESKGIPLHRHQIALKIMDGGWGSGKVDADSVMRAISTLFTRNKKRFNRVGKGTYKMVDIAS